MKKLVLTILLAIILLAGSACGTSNNNENVALVIVDVQDAYFEGGSDVLHNPLEALAKTEEILAKFRDGGLLVIHVEQVGLGDIHENVAPLENEILIKKRELSSFAGTDLEAVLNENNIEKLVIIGMQTNRCVRATIIDAAELGFEVTVLRDACAAKDGGTHNRTVESFEKYGAVINTDEWK